MDYLFVTFNFLQLRRKLRVLRELCNHSLSYTKWGLCLMVNHFTYHFFFRNLMETLIITVWFITI